MEETQVQVTVQCRDHGSGAMVDAVSASARIVKTDEAKGPGDVSEEHIYIHIKPGSQPNYQDAVISVNTDYKLTKADAGITE